MGNFCDVELQSPPYKSLTSDLLERAHIPLPESNIHTEEVMYYEEAHFGGDTAAFLRFIVRQDALLCIIHLIMISVRISWSLGAYIKDQPLNPLQEQLGILLAVIPIFMRAWTTFSKPTC